MTRLLFGLALLAVSPLGAQTVRGAIAGGAMMVTPDYSFSNYHPGWHVFGALQVGSPRSSFSVRLDGMHGESKMLPRGNVVTSLTGGTVNLVYRLAHAPLHLLAGPGLYHMWRAGMFDSWTHSRMQTVFGVGAGASVGPAPAKFFGEARYVEILNAYPDDPSHFFLVTAGVSFGN